jgi:hypothetical protein
MGIILTSVGLPFLASSGLIASPARAAGVDLTPPIPEPKPEPAPEPEPSEIRLLGPTSTISFRGVTFTFSNPVRYIESATGEPVVISHADYLPSGTTITAITPRCETDASGRIKNGAMINPVIETNATLPGYGQGFDGLMGVGPTNDVLAYVPGMNDDPAAPGNGSIAIMAGDRMTVVKSVRDAAISSSSPPANAGSTEKYVPLTVMDTLPPSAGTWFRPAASLGGQQMQWRHRAEDVDASIAAGVLRNLPAPAGLDRASWFLTNRVQADEMLHLPVWVSGQGDRTRRIQLSKEEPVGNAYSRDVARERCLIPCSLHIAPATQAEADARRKLAVILAQWGIDIDGARQMGMTFRTGAGQNHGIQTFIFLAAFLLGDEAMLERARLVEGNAINQLWWLREQHVGYPVQWDAGSQGGGRRVCRETYHPTDIGVPEWSVGGWDCLDPKAVISPDLSSNMHALYRDVQFTTQVYELLPVCLLQNGFGRGMTGDAAIRNGAYGPDNTRSAALAYLDRQMTFEPWTKDGVGGHALLARAMYGSWRDLVAGQPRWTGRPDTPENPADRPEFSTGGAGAGELILALGGINYSTLPVTDRQVQISHDNVQFADVTAINAGNALGTKVVGRLAGLRPGVTNVRWRQRNAAGWSRWTPTWPMSLSTGTDAAKYKAVRNQFTIPGTASGTLTRVVDPALHFNPYPGNQMPYYVPVTGSSDLSQIETLHAGMGYWTGGTGALSATYQWQRSSNNATWSNIAGATGKSYDRTAADIGNYVRCVVTVNGAAFNTAAGLFPAAQTFDSSAANILIKTGFDAMFPYEWPRVARTYGNAFEVHLPHFAPAGSPDEKGGIWASKTGTNPWINLLITSDLQAGTYAYKVVASVGQYAAQGNSSAMSASGNHVLNIWENSSGTVWVSRTIPVATAAQPAAYEFAGQFSVGGGDAGSTLNVRLQNLANVGGIAGGSPGLLYLEITKVA